MIHNKTVVVTSIIGNENDVLILKRSKKAKSFKHKWGGISGYFEKNEDLLSRALIEIYEETKINKENLTLRKILKQITIEIEKEKSIMIQPFYFYSGSKNVSMNWEHSEHRWITKNQLDSYETVPKLAQILYECFSIDQT
jgi:8-oxo-dGTP diphosphatase